MIKSVAFDIDGTLTDDVEFTVKEFLKAYEERYGKPYTKKVDYSIYPPENMFDAYVDDKDFLKKWKSELWEKIVSTDAVPLRKHMVKLTNDLHNKGIKVHIVTARYSSPEETNLEEREEMIKNWLRRNGFYFDTFHFGIHEKENQLASIGCDCLVDDSPEQAVRTSEKCMCFLVDTGYNKLVKGINIWRFFQDDFVTEVFLKKANYADAHSEVYGDTKIQISSVYNLNSIDKENSCIVHKAKGTSNTIFVIPARQKNSGIENRTLDILQKKPKAKVLRLNLISNPSEVSLNAAIASGDEIVIQILTRVKNKYLKTKRNELEKYNTFDDFLNDQNSTVTYMFKVDVIKEILKYVKSNPKELFVIDGFEVMMLSRDELKPYENDHVIISSCNEKDFSVLKKNIYNAGYSVFMLLEDLTDVSTQLRKWRIISGTAPKDLPGFINRQYSDSEGVDRVHLLPGEKPYNPEVLESILSMDTFLISDIHISSEDPEKTEYIVRNVNSRVSPKDHLIIVGDMDGKKGTSTYELLKKTIKKFRTKNIYLILGNNDQYSVEDYAYLGFLSVVDRAEMKDDNGNTIILTHCGIPVENGDFNIHGHMHGTKCYWNVDWHNHYDVWDQDFYPITIRECLQAYEKQLYIGKTEIHKNY